jgi:WD40 repeat protein
MARRFTQFGGLGVGFLACLALVGPIAAAPIPIAEVSRAAPVDFDQEILPLLQKSCLACHSASEKQGQLVLETVPQIQKGGDSGPAIVPGKSGESLLLKLASHTDDPVMPPPKNDVAAKAFTSQELGLIKLWIDQGANAGSGGIASPKNLRAIPSAIKSIQACALTADGQYAAATRGNQILIYHVPSGQLLTRLTDPALGATPDGGGIAHRDLVQSLAFNADGDQLASGGFREVKLWRRPRDVRTFASTASAELTALAIDPETKQIAAGCLDGGIQLLDAKGQVVRELPGHTEAVSGMRFLSKPSRLVSVSQDKSLRIWDVTTGLLIARWDVPQPFLAVEWLKSAANPPEKGQASDYLATGSAMENWIRLWRIPSPTPGWKLDAAEITASVLSADQTRLAVALPDGAIQIRKADTGELLQSWKASEKPIRELQFRPAPGMPSTTQLATAGDDGRARLWNLAEATPKAIVEVGATSAAITSISFHEQGDRLVVGSADGTLTSFQIDSPEREIGSVGADPIPVWTLSANGDKLAFANTVAGVPTITVRSTQDGQVLATLIGHKADITSLAFSQDQNRLISGSADQTARVWSLTESPPKELAQFAEHAAVVQSVGFRGDGAQAISGAANNSVKIWNPADGKLIADCPGHTGPISSVFFVGGSQPASASTDQTLRFWNGGGQQARAINESLPILRAAPSRDGARLAIALNDGSILLRNLDGSQVHQFKGHTAAVRVLQFSTDNARLLSVGEDQQAILWDNSVGRLEESMRSEPGRIVALSNSPHMLLRSDATGRMTEARTRYVTGTSTGASPITVVQSWANGQIVFVTTADGFFRGYSAANLAQMTFQQNHGAAIHALAVSADSQFVATAGEDRQIRLWNTSGSPTAPTQLTGFTRPVRSVAFTPDNLRVVGSSGDETQEILVFQRQDGTLDQAMVSPGPAIRSVSALASADSVLTINKTGEVSRMEIAALRRLPGHGGPVNAIVACPDAPGQFFSGSDDTTIRRWNADNGGQLAQYNHGGVVKALAVRPDGQRLASGSDNHVLKLWHVNGQQQPDMRGDLRLRIAAARRQQQQQAAQSRRDAMKQLLVQAEQDLPNKTNAAKAATDALTAANKSVEEKSAAVKTMLDAKTAAEKLAVEAAVAAQKAQQAKVDAELLASVSAVNAKAATDRATKLTQLFQATPDDAPLKQQADAAQLTAQAANTKSQESAAAVAAPTQAAQQAMTVAADLAQKAVAALKPWSDAVIALKLSQTQQNLAAQQNVVAVREQEAATALVPAAKAQVDQAEAALAEAVKLLETANQAVNQADQPIRTLAFSPDGRTLLSGGDYPAVQCWDGETGASVASYEGHQGPVRGVGFLDPSHLVSVSADKVVSGWESNPGWTLERTIGGASDATTFAHRVLALDFSDDGTLLACGGGEPSRSGEIKLFRVADGAPVSAIPEAHSDTIFSLQFSTDGKRIASGGADRYLKTFDVTTGKLIRRFEGHTHHVLGLAWKTDSSLITTASADGTLKTWNPETGDQVVTIMPNGKLVTAVRFIGDSGNIVSSNTDGIPRMHRANDGGLFLNMNFVGDYLHCIDVTPNQQTVIGGGHSGVLYVWNGQNGQLLQKLEPPSPVKR